MTDDLVTRAKGQAQAALNGNGRDSRTLGAVMGLLIARIEADAVTIARLTGRMEHWRRESDRAIHELTARAQLAEEWRDHDKERAEAAEAQVAALVEALVEALTLYSCEDGCNDCPTHERDRVNCGFTARAAIAAAKTSAAQVNSKDAQDV